MKQNEVKPAAAAGPRCDPPVVYERPEVMTGLDVDEEDGHHQVETGSAEADSVDRWVAHQHLTVTPTVGLVAHHVEERHLKHKPVLIYSKTSF